MFPSAYCDGWFNSFKFSFSYSSTCDGHLISSFFIFVPVMLQSHLYADFSSPYVLLCGMNSIGSSPSFLYVLFAHKRSTPLAIPSIIPLCAVVYEFMNLCSRKCVYSCMIEVCVIARESSSMFIVFFECR